METVHYAFSPEFMKTVSREYLIKTRGLIYAFIVLFTLIALLLMVFEGNAFFTGAFVMFGIFEILTYRNVQRRAVKNASTLYDQSMSATFGDEGVTFDNPDIVTIIKWRRIHSVTRLKSAWLFATFSESNYYVVPTSLITDSIKILIETKMNERDKQSM